MLKFTYVAQKNNHTEWVTVYAVNRTIAETLLNLGGYYGLVERAVGDAPADARQGLKPEHEHDRRCRTPFHPERELQDHDGPCAVLFDAPMTGLGLAFRDGWSDGNNDPQWMVHDTAGRKLRVSEYEVLQYAVADRDLAQDPIICPGCESAGKLPHNQVRGICAVAPFTRK